MNKISLSLLLTSALALAACQHEELGLDARTASEPATQQSPSGDFVDNRIRLKLTPEMAEQMSTAPAATTRSFSPLAALREYNRKTRSTTTGTEMSEFLANIGATQAKRVFPHAGRFEERTRREGLHLWYDIEFDAATTPLATVAQQAAKLTSVEVVERVRTLPTQRPAIVEVPRNTRSNAQPGGDYPFNDPLLYKQWHYHNDGTLYQSLKGADINLFRAWEIEKGKPSTIVAVIDGGIDYQHEDLAQSMWINEAEANGEEGVDDDGNGYIDDIYGFNFASSTGQISPEDHGTHVAGTIAARNNNGIGVSGIAGGDGTPASGARIMICQIFEGMGADGHEAAMKYAADNGAVISQNSWGYGHPGPGVMDPSLQAAIDYFIKYAGCDNDGNQLPESPMKGGVVIFAAGNDNLEYPSYPAAAPGVVSVSAFGPDFKASYFTTRGDYMTICAPGGSYWHDQGQVFSTLNTNQETGEARYGYQQGTSMACPHVSGVAALIVSKFGGQGFTQQQLLQRLTTALNNTNIDALNPEYAGKLGRGYLDAYEALVPSSTKVPAAVAGVNVVSETQALTFLFPATSNEEGTVATSYDLYLSTSPLTTDNYAQAEHHEVKADGKKAGEEIRHRIHSLQETTTYYYALVARDRWGNTAAPLLGQATTNHNNAPTIVPSTTTPIVLTGLQEAKVDLTIADPDGHELTVKVEGETRGVSYIQSEAGINFTLRPLAPVGTHSVVITATDEYRAQTKYVLSFTIKGNAAPRVLQPLAPTYVAVGQHASLRLDDYFADVEQGTLTYSIEGGSPKTASAEIKDGALTLYGVQPGETTLLVVATTEAGRSIRQQLRIVVTETALAHRLGSSLVRQNLDFRLVNGVKQGRYRIYNTIGELALEGNFSLTTSAQLVINVAQLTPGVYTCLLEANGQQSQHTFVKQ